jgi:site-specific DNA-methyltransferase (adenine-specific)/adenine-specific DNA-methyltransferase
MGSGTTQAVAMRLGRRFLGADINLGALHTTTKRLCALSKELGTQQMTLGTEGTDPLPLYTGFEVWNVNHYDVFRNPAQAKDLLREALEIQPLPGNTVWDGEKDGWMVKLMPINQIASRQDLNDIVANIDRRTLDRRRETYAPSRPLERIMLVCMGHEPDLGAYLKHALMAEGYNVDVDVVDILRHRTDLEFRRDLEAEVAVEGQQLVIRHFYPMNLLAKLSVAKESVTDWRELAETVMIDWNYDGVTFEPTTVDIPERKEDLVKGRYDLPAGTGTIRVKITDLLSESWEGSVVA